jgi:hypothetical protein
MTPGRICCNRMTVSTGQSLLCNLYITDNNITKNNCWNGMTLTSPSRSSPTTTQRMALLRCLRGSSGAGLRQVCLECTYVQEGDLLVVQVKT